MKRKPVQFALLIVCVASLVFVGKALAHALLVRSTPDTNAELSQPPATIELWFSEPVEEGFSSVRLITTTGDEIPLGAPVVDLNDPTHLSVAVGELEAGIYTVAWQTLSRTDGHEWLGSFPFTLLNPDGSRPAGTAVALNTEERSELPTPLQTLARWLALTGGILLVGIALFLSYVAAESMQANPELEARLTSLGLNLLGLAVLSILLGSWLQLAVQAAQLENLTLLPRLVYATYGGALNLARQALSLGGLLMVLWLGPRPMPVYQRRIFGVAAVYAAVLTGLLLLASLQGQGLIAALTLLTLGGMALLTLGSMAAQPGGDKRWNLLLLSGSATLFGFSVGSHAGAAPGVFWAVCFDMLHLLATSAWMGGLLLLPLILDQHRQTSTGADPSGLRALFRRYGYMAKLSFFLLWASGLLNSLVHIPSLDSLINTSYGQVLMLKVLLMLVVWGISMYGSRLFRGRPDPARVAALFKQFTRLASMAALVGLVLMIPVAVLVQTQPPQKDGAPDEGYHNYIDADDLSIHLQVTPAEIGLNQFYVQLSHADRSSIGDVLIVRLMFDQANSQLGQSKIDMQPLGPNRFWIEGPFLNQAGDWKVSVYVRRRGLDDVIADAGRFTLPMPPPQNNPFQNPVAPIPAGGLLAGVLIVLGLEILRWRKTLQQTALFQAFPYIGAALITLGVVMAVYIFLFFR